MPTIWPITKSSLRPVTTEIERFAGLNTATTASQIDDNQSPDLLNIILDAQGRPDKRFGFERIYADSLGAGKINGMFYFVLKDGTTRFLIHHNTNIYTQSGTDQPVSIYTLMADNRSVMWAFNNYVWIMDGTNYLRYDGTTIVTVASIAYIPTILISSPPAGGGTVNEDFNLLGPGFKQSFSGNGTATAFQLALTVLDASPLISAVVNGVTFTEPTGVTINRTTGLVTFSVAPTTGTNNVIITAYKTVAGKVSTITNCNSYVIFGGTQDTRVFWYGNPNFPSFVYRSGLFDPSYAPENGFIKIGSDASKVVNMVTQYDTCIIVKGNLQNAQTDTQNVYDVLIWQMQFVLTSGVASFPIKPVNNQIDGIAKDSMQLINNMPTWLSSTGIHTLQGTNVRDERNTQHISKDIDISADYNLTGLMQYNTLVNAVSVDYDKKYILALNDSDNTAFVFDYVLGVWLKWNNIKASCFAEINSYLYFGDNATGLVYRFLKINDQFNFNDDHAAINAYWKSKLLDFGTASQLKTAPRLWYHLKPADSASVDLSYITDQYFSQPGTFPTDYISLFNYLTWDYANFSYAMSSFPSVTQVKIKAKKFMYLQIILANPRVNESMGILVIHIDAQVVKMAK